MEESEITALAREYAEFACPIEAYEELIPFYKDDAIERKSDMLAVEMQMEQIFEWLLRRFCLVEKENIEKYFQSRNYILSHQDEYAVYIVRESEVEMKLLRCLFPEIAKEVEG